MLITGVTDGLLSSSFAETLQTQSSNSSLGSSSTSSMQQLLDIREKQVRLTHVFEDGMSHMAESLGELDYKEWRRSTWHIPRPQCDESNIVSADSSQSAEEQLSEIIQKMKKEKGRYEQREYGKELAIQYLKYSEQIAFDMKSLWGQIHPPSKEVLAKEALLFEKSKTVFSKGGPTIPKSIGWFVLTDHILGTILWEMAKIFDVDNFFVPTCQVKVFPSEQTVYLSQNGKRIDFSNEKNGGLLREGLCTAIMLALIFGMRTERRDIFVHETFPIFKPHTLIMPHSNGMINIHCDVVPAFHSYLLSFEGCYELLTPKEKEQMSRFLSKFTEERCEELQDLLNSYETAFDDKERFNPEQMMAAFKERLVRLKEALILENDQIRNLRDITFAVYPELKYFVAIGIEQIVAKKKEKISVNAQGVSPWEVNSSNQDNQQAIEGFQCSYFSGASVTSNSLVYKNGQRIKLQTVLEWCEDPTLSFDTIVEKIITSSEDSRELTEEEYKEKIRFMCKKIKGTIDYKGWG